jgi:long-chain acyl-CoA synthetase
MELLRSMLHVLHQQVSELADHPALWSKKGGVYRSISWSEYGERVKHLALGLRQLGLSRGGALTILSFNREEWVVAELAAMALGAVAVGLYTTSSPNQIQYVVSHCESELILVENEGYLEVLERLRPSLPKLRQIVVMDPPAAASAGIVSYQEVIRLGERADEREYWESIAALDPSSLACLIYTSGTTGNPKGVMLSHHNLVWTARQLSSTRPLSNDDVGLSYLPLSHIAEQICTIYGPLLNGVQIYFAESLEALPQNLKEARPTVFFGVPRVWEKFKDRAEASIASLPVLQRRLIGWARRITLERNLRSLSGERIPRPLEFQYQLARRKVFSKLKERIGFDRTQIFSTSAAPIGKDVLEFFASLDIIIREVYGQSEVTGPTSVSTEDSTHLGLLGRPMIGVEVKIADDGEILVRGDNVCMGYYKDPAATAELLRDGWLHSGDVGKLDADGYLQITGRKKEIIVTSGGKKTAPAGIEALLRSIPLVGNALVVGERRSYLVALIALDPERTALVAKEHGWPETVGALIRHRPFLQHLEGQIEQQVNRKLARFETIKRFAVVPEDFSVKAGELTPTLKLRRTAIEQKYSDLIESLYAPEAAAVRAGVG